MYALGPRPRAVESAPDFHFAPAVTSGRDTNSANQRTHLIATRKTDPNTKPISSTPDPAADSPCMRADANAGADRWKEDGAALQGNVQNVPVSE